MDNDTSPIFLIDFSDIARWEQLIAEIGQESEEGFKAYVGSVSDNRFDGASPAVLVEAADDALVAFAVDRHALKTGEVLCIDTADPSRVFRARIRDLWMVENNLSIANMDFEEFMQMNDENGLLGVQSRHLVDRVQDESVWL